MAPVPRSNTTTGGLSRTHRAVGYMAASYCLEPPPPCRALIARIPPAACPPSGRWLPTPPAARWVCGRPTATRWGHNRGDLSSRGVTEGMCRLSACLWCYFYQFVHEWLFLLFHRKIVSIKQKKTPSHAINNENMKKRLAPRRTMRIFPSNASPPLDESHRTLLPAVGSSQTEGLSIVRSHPQWCNNTTKRIK